jgi:hypothetical protein
MASIGFEPLIRIACAFLAPTGRNAYLRLTQGKPWAMLFWHLRAVGPVLQTYISKDLFAR